MAVLLQVTGASTDAGYQSRSGYAISNAPTYLVPAYAYRYITDAGGYTTYGRRETCSSTDGSR